MKKLFFLINVFILICFVHIKFKRRLEIELSEENAENNERGNFEDPNKSFELAVPTEQDKWEI